MDQWLLIGAGPRDLPLRLPGVRIITAEQGRILAVGQLEPLLKIIRMPGFQLHLLQYDPPLITAHDPFGGPW